MKKLFNFLLMFVFIVISAACSKPNSHRTEFGFWELYQQSGATADSLENEYRELLLEDFDFLIEKLTNYSPHFNIIERRMNIDLTERLYNQRAQFETMQLIHPLFVDWSVERSTRLIADNFFNQIRSDFERLQGFSHMNPVSRHVVEFNYIHCLIYCAEENTNPLFATDLSNVRNFYQLDLVDIHRAQENPRMQLDEDNIKTQIIVPGKIAYVSFNHFFNITSEGALFEQNILFPFYHKIQDFDHLIFDFRGHLGGFSGPFMNLIVGPLIDSPLQAESHQFVRATVLERLESHEDNFFRISNIAIDNSETVPAVEFVANRRMSEFNTDDLELLDYVVVTPWIIEPVEVDFSFNGKIWILVDNMTASAAEFAVLFAMDTGFATVVGTNTMGVMPSATAMAVLPHTGIVFRFDVGYFTDAYGRSLEEFGITPDYVNRPGMDALQTVLAMIEEMENSYQRR